MNDVQPVQARTVRVPDYFAEFRERGDGLAAFLGASIVAKVCDTTRGARNARSPYLSDYIPRRKELREQDGVLRKGS